MMRIDVSMVVPARSARSCRDSEGNPHLNYYSENREPDLDSDGLSDRPYRLWSVFDHLRGNLTAADLLAQGLGARALSVAEEAFPVIRR